MSSSEKKATEAVEKLKVNEQKWTKPLMDAGWTAMPNVIIERQKALGLDALDINILLHLAAYWWTPDNLPHPSKKTIAEAIGVDPRTVQRRIAEMEAGGLIKREERRISAKGSLTNRYHFTGLINEATPYAMEKIQEISDRAEEKKARIARKGRPKLRLVKKGADE